MSREAEVETAAATIFAVDRSKQVSSLLSFGSSESITIKSAWQVGRVDMFLLSVRLMFLCGSYISFDLNLMEAELFLIQPLNIVRRQLTIICFDPGEMIRCTRYH